VSPPGEIVRERLDGVLLVRIDRPEVRNALTWDMARGLGAAMVDAEDDPGVRAVVLAGTGDIAFCAGMDLHNYISDDKPTTTDTAFAAYRRLLDGEVSVPVIAAVNGHALAAGFEILLGCDIIVASSRATFGLPEVKRGLLAGGGVMHVGSRLPVGVALELSLTGDPIDAARAHQIGLVNWIVPPGEVVSTALRIAERIAQNGPLAVTATKEIVRMAMVSPSEAKERLGHWVGVVFNSRDAKEGARAFLEKRPPMWRGD
jgi:enoyl-CoA hydratase/carnithine racemase